METLGTLLERSTNLKVPKTIDTSPIALRDWDAIVGSRIAARARPVALERRVLLVRCASATWAQELSLLADAILEQLRARRFDVAGLRFHVGTIAPVPRPPQRDEVRRAPPPATLPANLDQKLAQVEDPELRAVIARAAAKNLGWQDQQRSAATKKKR